MVHLYINRINTCPSQRHIDQPLTEAPELCCFLVAHKLAHRRARAPGDRQRFPAMNGVRRFAPDDLDNVSIFQRAA